jgi:hypothetical protein
MAIKIFCDLFIWLTPSLKFAELSATRRKVSERQDKSLKETKKENQKNAKRKPKSENG